MNSILIIDDEKEICESVKMILDYEGYQTDYSLLPSEGLNKIDSQNYSALLLDIQMPEMNGFEVLKRVREKYLNISVIIITAHGSVENAIKATKLGAFDFIEKPIDRDKLLISVRNAVDQNKLLLDNEEMKRTIFGEGKILGKSKAIHDILQLIEKVAPLDTRVLITGENGTGKELVARALHKHSLRSSGPFVPVNCGAVTETLLEAELFGHVKGSFTGAAADRRGLWEEAEGGTLFLDEIGETSPSMQVKLLRALQEKEIRRVGANRNISVDARVVAATNRELEEELVKGTFREDLYYRLSVVTLRVPPLRERRSDIPLLAGRFLQDASENAGHGRMWFQEETLKILASYDWPGNVRELESAVEYAALRSRGNEIGPDDLPPKMQSEEIRAKAARAPLRALYDDLPTLDELERRYLLHVLEVVGENRTRAAEVMGIDRRTLYRMAERFDIKSEDESRNPESSPTH